MARMNNRSRGGLAVRVPSTLATKTTTRVRILGVAICSRVDSKRSESRDGYSSTIKMPVVKSSSNFTLLFFIIERHKIQYHFHADDTQLYLSFDPCDAQSAMARLNSCLVDIRAWMADNFLN